MTSGRQGAPYFQELRRTAGFKTGDCVEEKLGGGYCRATNTPPVCLHNIRNLPISTFSVVFP